MSTNNTLPVTLDDHLALLGGVAVNRVRLTPSPDQASMDDLIRAHQRGSLCELVDGILVEKAVEYEQSVAAYTSPTAVQVLGETDAIDGGVALHGFTAHVSDFFADLDIGQEMTDV